jgi:hypothetical protein
MYLDNAEKRRLIRDYFRYRNILESLAWLEDESIFEYQNIQQVISNFLDETVWDLYTFFAQRRLPTKSLWLIASFVALVVFGFEVTRATGLFGIVKPLVIILTFSFLLGIVILIYLLPKLKLRKIIYRVFRDNLPKPSVTDEQIIKWLNEDIYKLVRKSLLAFDIDDYSGCMEVIKSKLKVEDHEFEAPEQYSTSHQVNKQNLLQQTPLYLLSGCSVSTLKSLIKIDFTKNRFDEKQLLIPPGDFYCVRTLNSRKKIYGVYEVIVIFLCKNFLSYYRCYWNFVRGVSINDEMCEYLYDSIVSVKIRERASSNIIDSRFKKRVYSEYLSITTQDSREIEFKIDEDRKFSSDDLYDSRSRKVAQAIRRMLRQRRIDVMRVEQENKESLFGEIDWEEE